VQPLFVFDGSRKPTFKRNKRSGHNAGSLSNVLTKQVLKLFGFPFHIAPGEAEAECALLQREGIVDAVLSEDVDTLMFGCGLTLRNWSSEGSRGNHPPTHVSMYDAKVTKEGKSGLDREGMILIAMMSGGDYITSCPSWFWKITMSTFALRYGWPGCLEK
jgi:Holliday junction resolvase YEN1